MRTMIAKNPATPPVSHIGNAGEFEIGSSDVAQDQFMRDVPKANGGCIQIKQLVFCATSRRVILRAGLFVGRSRFDRQPDVVIARASSHWPVHTEHRQNVYSAEFSVR